MRSRDAQQPGDEHYGLHFLRPRGVAVQVRACAPTAPWVIQEFISRLLRVLEGIPLYGGDTDIRRRVQDDKLQGPEGGYCQA